MVKKRKYTRHVNKTPAQRAGNYVHRHRYIIATATTVSAGVLGVIAAAKLLPVGAATAVGIGIGYLTVTAVGGIGAMAIKDGSINLKATVEKQHVPAH